MKKLQLSLEPWLDKMDSHWKQLPQVQRKRVVLYSFAGYLAITLATLVQVISQVGQQREMPIKHITNPLANGIDRGTKLENKKELKNGNNERE
jgi:hypothetical protein